MKKLFRGLALLLGALAFVAAGATTAVIAFNAPSQVPALAAGESIPGISQWNQAEIPAPQSVKARDGAPLNYRLYPGRKDRAIILVHGSSGTGYTMHKLAQALQAAGGTVYTISLRGHGGSGTVNGDTSYKGQLDDDLVDFVTAAGLVDPQVRKTLAGFSSGGGFVLRTASGPNQAMFNDYLAIAPYIAQDSPTTKPGSGGWASVAVPRVVALSILDGLGLPWFQHLPVVRFATDAQPSANRTPVYSYRLAAGLQLPRDWRQALARIREPTLIVVGSKDELFNAEAFSPTVAPLNSKIAVEIVPERTHLGMIGDPVAIDTIVAAWRKLADSRAAR
jgi:alpha-beta hydrolase superfamily lysophospholipase